MNKGKNMDDPEIGFRELYSQTVFAVREVLHNLETLALRMDSYVLLAEAKERQAVDWHTREEVPPRGPIWASDGDATWLIMATGSPIPETASSVKFWTNAVIPNPPNQQKSRSSECR